MNFTSGEFNFHCGEVHVVNNCSSTVVGGGGGPSATRPGSGRRSDWIFFRPDTDGKSLFYNTRTSEWKKLSPWHTDPAVRKTQNSLGDRKKGGYVDPPAGSAAWWARRDPAGRVAGGVAGGVTGGAAGGAAVGAAGGTVGDLACGAAACSTTTCSITT